MVLGIFTLFLTTTAFTPTQSTISSRDGVTTCPVYGAEGYTATVIEKVIVPNKYGSLAAKVKLNKSNGTKHDIRVVVELRNAMSCVVESQELFIGKNLSSGSKGFDHKGASGEVYYVTINSASCN